MSEVFPIKGAVCLADAELYGDTLRIKPMNPEYKYAMKKGGYIWASKNGHNFVIALSIEELS